MAENDDSGTTSIGYNHPTVVPENFDPEEDEPTDDDETEVTSNYGTLR